MDLLNGVKKFGGGLLDFAQALGGQRFSPDQSPLDGALGEYAPVLQKQYDRNFRAARGQAIRAGAGWGEMNDVAASVANAEHQQGMINAIRMADALTQRRQAEGRTSAIHKYIEAATDLTPQQKAALEAMAPEDAAKVLAEQAFVDPNQDRYSMTALGNGYLAVLDRESGDTEIQHDPKWSADKDRQLSLMRSEEGNDIVFRNPLTGVELNRVKGGASRKFKPTEGQYKAAGFAARMQKSDGQLRSEFRGYVPSAKEYAAFTKMGQEGSEFSTAMLKAALNKAGMSPKARQYFQNVNEWARAKLRYESGAVIAMEEIVNELNTYFGIPGDDPGTVGQKERSRLLNNDTMKHAAADSWDMWLEDHPEFATRPKTAAERAAELRDR